MTDMGRKRDLLGCECGPRTRVCGQDHLPRRRPALQRSGAAAGAHVGLAVNGGDDVAAGLHPELIENRRAFARKPAEDACRIGHHVSHDADLAAGAFGAQCRRRAFVGREEERGDAVDLDPVALLGHLEVAAAKAGLDVGSGSPLRRRPALRRASSSCRRRRARRRAMPSGRRQRWSRSVSGSAVRRSSRCAGAPRPSSTKKISDSAASQCWPVCTTISSMAASRKAAESGADLMNWGRLPTMVTSFMPGERIRPACRHIPWPLRVCRQRAADSRPARQRSGSGAWIA